MLVDGLEVNITSPDRLVFPQAGITKMELVEYYLKVAEGALRAVRERPMILKRFPRGIDEEPFYQKRAPKGRPEWVRTCTIRFPSGRSADEVVCHHPATLAWLVNIGCVELHPWPVRWDDIDHPDELRADLDPTPGVPFSQVREVALMVRQVLQEHGLEGFPKTSGSRGIHILVPIERRYSFDQVRHAALALAREVERRMPDVATSAWWKEERQGVFIDYNQNARDRTLAAAFSVRPNPQAQVSCPLQWDEVPTVEPQELTLFTVPERFARLGPLVPDPDTVARGRLESLLELADQEGEAPLPPHHPKAKGEPRRVQPSRRRD
ncbi:MAG: non-homologous end-joining DNA ligase [Vulcanimicrobiota bacterium]